MSDTQIKSYVNEEIGKLPFCPGCGHNTLTKAIDKALVKLQYDPKDVVIVTDIGCIGLSDRHFITNAFHGLHGRSITYACGIKMANPKLKVIAIKGDGACGIGGTHLLNVARRNIGITLIIGNNFNYGMTGGQHSVTTPTEGITSTTPYGNVEGPMNIAGTAMAAGASWVHRTTVFDKELPDVIATAIEHDGFSMIDAWEICTAYYGPRNEMKKKDLFDLLDGYGFELGQLVDKPRPEYSTSYWQAYEKSKGLRKELPKIESRYDHKVDKQLGIVIAGSAGQKIKSAATMFAAAAMYAKLEATQKDDYPITVMTGHSVAEINISPETIQYTAIDAPDIFIALSEDGVKRTAKKIQKLPESCVVYTDESLELPATKAKVVRLPLLDTAKKTSKLSLAIIGLAAMIEDSGIFPLEAFSDAVTTFQASKTAEINNNAMKAGAELTKAK